MDRMNKIPSSPYHQFSNSSLNSDFYDRYLSLDGHQPLQTPLIGIERTQDLLKLPPHGHDDQDSQRFHKEWSFADDSKLHDDSSRSSSTPPSSSSSSLLLRGNKTIKETRKATNGESSAKDNTSTSLLYMKHALLNQQQQQQPIDIPNGFFFRYNRLNGSPGVHSSKSSRQSNISNVGHSDGRASERRQQALQVDHNNYDHEDDNHDDHHDEDNDNEDTDDEDGNNSKGQDMFAESMKHFNPPDMRNRPSAVIDHQSDDVVCYDLRSKNTSPDDQQQHQQQQKRQSAGSEHSDTDNATSLSQQYHGQESCFGLDPSKQRFQYVLAAPISVATKLQEDTMTYLNQGQAYEIKLGNVTDVAEARKGFMCSIINIGFYERHMQQAENELWQQWSQQHPNEKIFSVDMKLSYNVYGVDSDGLNKYEFLWDSSKAAGVFIRINSISTEFTPKKHGGEKGVPFRLSIETFSYNSKTHDSYFISAASCQIKVFKPKGAERKIRSDRDKIYKRPPSEQDKYHRSCDHTTFSECPLTSLHPMADTSLCYYRHSHGHFASKQVSTSGGGGGGGGGSGAGGASSSSPSSSSSSVSAAAVAAVAAQAHSSQNGSASGHNSDDEHGHTPPGGGNQQADQNNSAHHSSEDRDANSPNSNNHQQQHHHHHRHHQHHQHELNEIKLQTDDSPYLLSSSSSSHHRLSAMHPYRHDSNHHNPLDQRNTGNDLSSFSNHSNNTSYSSTQQATNNDHSQYPATNNHQTVRAGLTAASLNSATTPHTFNSMSAHYYGHPLAAASLVPPHHHPMASGSSYGISASSALAGGPISHPAATAGFVPLPSHHHHQHIALPDVKSSIYHRHHHHQLVAGGDKQPFGQHAAASYGADFKSHHQANLGQLASNNYQNYFAASSSSSSAAAGAAPAAADCPSTTESLSHDQTSTTRDHHQYPHQQQQHQQINNNSLANSSNTCYNNNNNNNDNYNNSNHHIQHSLRQRSVSTSLATHCQNSYTRHHLDNYLTSSVTTAGSNENLSSSQNNNSNNQWSTHQNTGATMYSANNNGYTDCANMQTSDSPSSCCSRYKLGGIHQPYNTMSQTTTNESVVGALDIKCLSNADGSNSAHITINSNCIEVISWFASNRFGILAKTFNNFSGADLLRLSKSELIEICGLIEGIRLFNSIHIQPIKPRRVLYICLQTDMDIYNPIYLYDLSLDELLREISLILESNSTRANNNNNDEDNNDNDDNDEDCLNSHHRHHQTGRTNSTTSSGSSTDSRSSSRTLSAEMNEDEVYQSEQYFEEMHPGNSCSDQDKNQITSHACSNRSTLESPPSNNSINQQHRISRLLVDGVASVKVVATEKVVQMLEDESVWTLSIQTRDSGLIEACITACRTQKRHCK